MTNADVASGLFSVCAEAFGRNPPETPSLACFKTRIDRHLRNRPSGVGKDDLLDAAVAAWTALRLQRRESHRVCEPEHDERGLEVAIWY